MYVTPMYKTTFQPNARLHVADALRGIAIIGIILLHNVEHMDLYKFPKAADAWLIWLNKATWDGLFFAFGGKMYSIFALMFGLSFFIQNDNQMQQGKDFTLRFMWRMVLLMLFGLVNKFFCSGDILFIYAVFGMLLPFAGKLNTRALVVVTCILLLQPFEIYQIVSALLNPDFQLININSTKYFNILVASREHGGFWESGWSNWTTGQINTFLWNIKSGRIAQLPGLFFLGILLGRLRLFYNEKDNLKKWLVILAVALVVFFPALGLHNTLPEHVTRKALLVPLRLLCKAWSGLALTFVYVSMVVLLYYTVETARRLLMNLAFFGRASLTNYFMQSVFGALLWYGWGFGLHRYCGQFFSLLVGVGMVAAQYAFCRWWLKTRTHGPMEWVWKKLTWMKS